MDKLPGYLFTGFEIKSTLSIFLCIRPVHQFWIGFGKRDCPFKTGEINTVHIHLEQFESQQMEEKIEESKIMGWVVGNFQNVDMLLGVDWVKWLVLKLEINLKQKIGGDTRSISWVKRASAEMT